MKTFLKWTLVLLPSVVLAFIGWGLWQYHKVDVAVKQYRPQVGDVLVQSIEPCGRLLRTVKGVTQSKWNHCGVVDNIYGKWMVCEAVGDGVQYTKLADFIDRGDSPDFAVYRLKPEHATFADAFAKFCGKYVGRPYDIQYELDDSKIYCSELVYKAYKDATGETLGVVQPFGELNWQEYEDDIRHYHGIGELPLKRKVVTPVSLTSSPQLEKVFDLQEALTLKKVLN